MSQLPPEYWGLPAANNSASVDDNVTYIVETIQFCLFCTTISIYSLIVWALIEAQLRRVDELTSPFFKLCLSTAGVDIWTLLTNYFGAMFPKWGWFIPVYMALGNYYARVYMYFAWSTGICQAMGVSVLASNRLSVMLFPTNFHRMWQGHRLWIAIGVQYLVGLTIGMATFLNQVQLFRTGKSGVVPKFLNRVITNVYFAIGGVFLVVNCTYLVLTYFYLFWVLHKRQKQLRSQPTQTNSKTKDRAKTRETRLFTMITIIVGVQLTVVLFFVSRFAEIPKYTSDQFYLMYNALSDLYASINPYLLWIFSDSLRTYIFQRIGFVRKETKIVSITSMTLIL